MIIFLLPSNDNSDGQRTMAIPGASTSLSLEDVDLKLLKNTKILYLEGYLFDLPDKESFNTIVDKKTLRI